MIIPCVMYLRHSAEDLSEHRLPALQTPLVREAGTLVVTDARIYFQPLHDIAGDSPVRSHPLVAVAAVVRRRSSLRPLGVQSEPRCGGI